jgi:hypothetical protein
VVKCAERLPHRRSDRGGEGSATGMVLPQVLRISQKLQNKNILFGIVFTEAGQISIKPILGTRLKKLIHGRLVGDRADSFPIDTLLEQITRAGLADYFEIAIALRYIYYHEIISDDRFWADKLTIQQV